MRFAYFIKKKKKVFLRGGGGGGRARRYISCNMHAHLVNKAGFLD